MRLICIRRRDRIVVRRNKVQLSLVAPTFHSTRLHTGPITHVSVIQLPRSTSIAGQGAATWRI